MLLWLAMVAIAASQAGAPAGGLMPPGYKLENSSGDFYLYSGFGYRGFVSDEAHVTSLQDLKDRVAKFPRGAFLGWGVYNLDSAGKPLLFEDGQFEEFQAFCWAHGIVLNVDVRAAQTTDTLIARLKEPLKGDHDDSAQRIDAITKLGQRHAYAAVPVLIQYLFHSRNTEGIDKFFAENAGLALEQITGRRFGTSGLRWTIWYWWPWMAGVLVAGLTIWGVRRYRRSEATGK